MDRVQGSHKEKGIVGEKESDRLKMIELTWRMCQESSSLSFCREMLIIECVAVVGSKALSVKAPWLCLCRADFRYWGRHGRGIIHDLTLKCSLCPEWDGASGVTGLIDSPYQPPGMQSRAAAGLGFCSSPALSVSAHIKHRRVSGTNTVTLGSVCVWHKWHVLHVYGWAGGWMLGMWCVVFPLPLCLCVCDIFSFSFFSAFVHPTVESHSTHRSKFESAYAVGLLEAYMNNIKLSSDSSVTQGWLETLRQSARISVNWIHIYWETENSVFFCRVLKISRNNEVLITC